MAVMLSRSDILVFRRAHKEEPRSRAKRGRPGRNAQTEPPFGSDRMRELSSSAVRDERVHVAGCVQPTVRERRIRDAGVSHELTEMRLDTRGLFQAHEVRDYGHVGSPLMANARHGAGTRWWAV